MVSSKSIEKFITNKNKGQATQIDHCKRLAELMNEVEMLCARCDVSGTYRYL